MSMSGDSSKRLDIVARRVRSDDEKRPIIAEASEGSCFNPRPRVSERRQINPVFERLDRVPGAVGRAFAKRA